MQERASTPTIHIINKFATATGGSEQRALRLGEILARHANVKIWATHEPDPALLERAPIATIELRRLRFPMTGTFVFMGAYLHIGRWIRFAHPGRRIIVFNTKNPEELEKMAGKISPRRGLDDCELVYADGALRDLVGRPGVIHQSPIDLEKFHVPVQPKPKTAPFTVGRLSRDYRYKFHEDDPALFQQLAGMGIHMRLMGGTCLAAELGENGLIERIAEGRELPVPFLHSLDCFLYRTSSNWLEAFGRVVFEAMACGLPVVCGTAGGYARHIEDGTNGFLFRDGDEAVRIIASLRDDPALRHRIGKNARETVENMYSAAFEQEQINFYTRK